MAPISALALASVLLPALAAAQQIGHFVPEIHPHLPTQRCTTHGGCVPQLTSIVLDQFSRSIHKVGNPAESCDGSAAGLDPALCPSAEACARNCALEGADYADSGVRTSGDAMTLNMYRTLPNGTVLDVSPRVYLLDDLTQDYVSMQLLGQEIAFDVDLSQLVCGMNGALYLSEMDASGGRGPLNPAGASYGTGYCDAQCPKEAFINGVANIGEAYGACCNEMDLWEANALATQLTPHACNVTGVYSCMGDLCGAEGVCDETGCGFNPYRWGAQTYYGRGDTVDTDRKFTAVTQFVTDDGTTHGTLVQIRRLYVQDGKVIPNAVVDVDVAGVGTIDSITPAFCDATAARFTEQGGLTEMGQALGRGMVLVFSLWSDATGFMDWLDEGTAGPCSATAGNPAIIEQEEPGVSVTFSNIKWGDINSTYRASSGWW